MITRRTFITGTVAAAAVPPGLAIPRPLDDGFRSWRVPIGKIYNFNDPMEAAWTAERGLLPTDINCLGGRWVNGKWEQYWCFVARGDVIVWDRSERNCTASEAAGGQPPKRRVAA